MGPGEVLKMTYSLLIMMLIDNNVIHERPKKEDPNKPKRVTGGGLAGLMRRG